MYDKLFERGKIGKLELKNRIFKPAAQSTPCYDGHVSEALIRFYEEEARGGVGLIIVGLARVSKYETPEPSGAIGIVDDSYISGFGALAQAIHENGAKCCLQLCHFGSHAYPPARCVSRDGLEHDFWLPEHHPGMVEYPHKEYSVDEIHELVGFYGDAAVRAVRAGFDMIEVHAGHRHGLGLFVSPLTNRRKDMYGGSYENRTRIVFEILADIKKKIGNAVPISVRINGSDQEPGGQEIDEAVRFAKDLEAFGIDAINVSNQNAVAGMVFPLGLHTWAAEAVKKEVTIPVLTCGSNNTPELAEETLQKGQADFVGTGRALFADPYWPTKAKNGKSDEIRPCIRCMECVGPKYSWVCPVSCTVNSRLGKEGTLPIVKAQQPKKIAVIGGGAAGMEAAVISTRRGHDVTIYEKRKLAGRLNEASVPKFKADIRRLIAYYENQIAKFGIKVVYKEADRAEIEAGGYDTAIVAVGAQPIWLDVKGGRGENVYNAIEVLEGKYTVRNKVAVIGGGAIGVETAILLASQGKEVIIIEFLEEILTKEYIFTKMPYLHMIEENKIKVMTSASLQSVCENSITVQHRDGKLEKIEVEDVIMSVGLKPDLRLREELEQVKGLEVECIGDCVEARKIFDAIHEGNTCGRLI